MTGKSKKILKRSEANPYKRAGFNKRLTTRMSIDLPAPRNGKTRPLPIKAKGVK